MNNCSVVPFSFDSHEVRVLTVEDEPWFVAKDVCDVLEIQNVTQAVQGLDEDERSMFCIGRQGDTNIISESGLYTLVIRSNKPQAKPFRRWVTHEVLPTIRKTGTYTIPNEKKVSVRHTHLRGSMAPSGLDIRYSLDLSKHIVNPTRTTLEILERITGIQLTDIELPFSASDDEIEKLFLEFVDEQCVVGDGLRISSFVLYSDFRKWLPKHSSVRIPTIKKFGGVVGRHFTRIKSSLIFFEGLHLVGKEVK